MITLLARALVPTRTARGIPSRITIATEMPVTMSRSSESCQNPRTPKERKERQTRMAMRQLAITSPMYVAIATTPSQPISGTGRGGLGTTIIRWTHSKALRSRSEIALVNCMTGLVSRLASRSLLNSVRRSCRSVRATPGRVRVSVPSVKYQTTIHTATIAVAGIQRLTYLRSGGGGAAPGSTGLRAAGAGAVVVTPPPRPRRPA